MAFKMKGYSAFTKPDVSPTGKKIHYDEEKSAEYVKFRGKKVYGSWNEMNPTRDNKVSTKGLGGHITQNEAGDWQLNEGSWDKVINP